MILLFYSKTIYIDHLNIYENIVHALKSGKYHQLWTKGKVSAILLVILSYISNSHLSLLKLVI